MGAIANENPKNSDSSPLAMDELRIDFTKLFGIVVAASSVVVLGMGCVMIYIALAKSASSYDKVVVLRVFQIAFGNFFGGVCVYLGLVLSWFGVRESIRMNAVARDRWTFMVNTSSPGVILMLGGILLIGISMFCRIEMSEKTGEGAVGSTSVFGVGAPPSRENDQGEGARKKEGPDPGSASHQGSGSQENDKLHPKGG